MAQYNREKRYSRLYSKAEIEKKYMMKLKKEEYNVLNTKSIEIIIISNLFNLNSRQKVFGP